MSNTLTIRKSSQDEKWLKQEQKKTAQSQGAIVKLLIEKARAQKPDNSAIKKFIGDIEGLPKNLSALKGFRR
jgi:hypothetical protein